MRFFRRHTRLSLDRTELLTRLVAFGQALGGSLEWDAVASAVAQHVPVLVHSRVTWLVALRPSGARILIDSTVPGTALSAAEDVLAGLDHGVAVRGGDVCVPLCVDGTVVGVLGLAPSDVPLQDDALESVASLLAVAMRNAARFEQVSEASARDALTTCFTRRHGLDVIDAELRRSRRAQQRATLVMFDLDGFKRVNDDHGHLCGDRVLAGIGQSMAHVLRVSDIKVRYGGDEFLVFLPDTLATGACHVADTLRQTFEATPTLWHERAIMITASFGIAETVASDTLEALVARADAALYRAKAEGRNRVILGDSVGLPS